MRTIWNVTHGDLERLEALIREQHTPEEGIVTDMGEQDTVNYCAGCGIDLDEEPCPYLAILDGPEYTKEWNEA